MTAAETGRPNTCVMWRQFELSCAYGCRDRSAGRHGPNRMAGPGVKNLKRMPRELHITV